MKIRCIKDPWHIGRAHKWLVLLIIDLKREKNSVTPSPSPRSTAQLCSGSRTKAWEVQNSRGSCASQESQAQGWQREAVKGVWAGRGTRTVSHDKQCGPRGLPLEGNNVICLAGTSENLGDGEGMSPSGLHEVDPVAGSRKPAHIPAPMITWLERSTSPFQASASSSIKWES